MVVVAFAMPICTPACSWDYSIWTKSKKSDTALFRFIVRETWGAGYVDRNGKVIIQPQFFHYGNYGDDDFFDGLAKVRREDGEWFINSKGVPIFATDYIAAGHFSEGLATFRQNGKVGYIDRTGRNVIPAKFGTAEEFSEGLASVRVGDVYGYIDKTGNYAVPPRLLMADSFSEGFAAVVESGPCWYTPRGPCSDSKPVLLSRAGEIGSSRPDANTPRCRFSFIDTTGNRPFAADFAEAKSFSVGLAAVSDGSRWGYTDRAGNIVVPLTFDNAGAFSDGMAAVLQRDKWGYIDRAGKFVIAPQFASAMTFSEGLAVVGNGAEYWFIDKSGRQAIDGRYSAASGFVMGLAHVRVGSGYYSSKWSYIDRRGHKVFTYSIKSRREG